MGSTKEEVMGVVTDVTRVFAIYVAGVIVVNGVLDTFGKKK